MIVNSDRFKSITEGLKNIVLSLAVIVGGGWALIQFNLLQQVEKAKAEVQELHQKIEQTPKIDIHIETSQVYLPAQNHLQLLGIATIQNIGTKFSTLNFLPNTITAAKIDFDGEGKVVYGKVYNYKLEDQIANYRFVTVSPGESHKLPFLFQFDEAGIYSILFRTELSENEPIDKEASKHVGVVTYTQQVFVVVGGSQGGNLTLRSSGTAQKRAAP